MQRYSDSLHIVIDRCIVQIQGRIVERNHVLSITSNENTIGKMRRVIFLRRVAFIRLLIPVFCAVLSTCSDPAGSEISQPTPSTLHLTFSGDSLKNKDSEDCTPSQMISVLAGDSCQVTISWTSCSDSDFRNYALYRNDRQGIEWDPSLAEVIATFTASAETSFVDTEPDWGDACYYALLTWNTGELSSWSNEEHITMPGVLPERAWISAETIDWNALLTWTACSDYDFLSYSLFRSDRPGIESDTSAALRLDLIHGDSDTTFTDSLPTPDDHYYYTILTRNNKGMFRWSNEVSVHWVEPEEPEDFPWRVNGELDIPYFPFDMAVTPSGNEILLGFRYLSLYIVDTTTLEFGIVPGYENIRSICMNPMNDLAYLSPERDDILIEFDLNSGGVQNRTLQLSAIPGGCCTDPEGRVIFVPGADDNIIFIVDALEFKVVDQVCTDSRLRSLTSHPSGDYVYGMSCMDNDLTIVATDPVEVVDVIPIGSQPTDMTISPDGSSLYISCTSSNEIWVISCPDHQVKEVISSEGPQSLCFLPSGEYLYVASFYDNIINVYSVPDHILLKSITLGSPAGQLSAMPSGLEVWAGCFEDLVIIGF